MKIVVSTVVFLFVGALGIVFTASTLLGKFGNLKVVNEVVKTVNIHKRPASTKIAVETGASNSIQETKVSSSSDVAVSSTKLEKEEIEEYADNENEFDEEEDHDE